MQKCFCRIDAHAAHVFGDRNADFLLKYRGKIAVGMPPSMQKREASVMDATKRN